jgi:hypothetical protein
MSSLFLSLAFMAALFVPVSRGADMGETVVKEPSKATAPRKVIDQKALEKMGDSVCVEGFKAYVGMDSKNICRNWATPPDIAYTCNWTKKGPPAYASTDKGPCNLDFTEHRGDLIVTKQQWKSDPPLDYGTQVQCCYRSASGPEGMTQ